MFTEKWRPRVLVTSGGNIVVRPIRSYLPFGKNREYYSDDGWAFEMAEDNSSEAIRKLRNPASKAELKEAVAACQKWCIERNKSRAARRSFARDARLKATLAKSQAKAATRAERWSVHTERKMLNGGK